MKNLIRDRIDLINRGIAPEGYKIIDSKIVPKEWMIMKLGDLFDFYGGLGISRGELGETGIPYLHYGDMHCSNANNISYEEYLMRPKYEINLTGREKYLINDGDIVFLDASEDLKGTSRMVLVNNPNNEKFISGLHTIVAKSKLEMEILISKYKQFITMTDSVQKQFVRLSSGFKVYGINKTSIKDIVTFFPKNKDEQEKIANILIDENILISIQEKLVNRLELKKKALMQKLIKPQDDWQLCYFKDFYTDAGEGGTPPTKNSEYYINGDIPFVKIEHLENKYIEKIDCFITAKGLKNSGAWLIPENSLIFSNGATIGQVSINKIPVTTKQGILGIVPSNKVTVEFLYYMMKSPYFLNKVRSITTRGTIFTAYLKDLDKLELAIPDRNEQEKIVKVLSQIDDNIDLHKKKLSKIKQQQKALTQLLLTGIVRVL